MSPATNTYSFTVHIHGADVLSVEGMDALLSAGCDDATFGARDGAQYAEFDRQATSFSAALTSALHDVTSALPGLEIVRVEREMAAAHGHMLPLPPSWDRMANGEPMPDIVAALRRARANR